jgi:hypothetical protein
MFGFGVHFAVTLVLGKSLVGINELFLQGNTSVPVNNYQSIPVFVDEIIPGSTAATTVLRQSIPMRTVQSGNQMACTLTASQFAHEGFGSVSLDGSTFHFGKLTVCHAALGMMGCFDGLSLHAGCYNLPPNGTTLGYASAGQRVIARVFANGAVAPRALAVTMPHTLCKLQAPWIPPST